MRLRTKFLATLALLAAITTHAAEKSDAAKVMFEAAKKKELVDGDLNGAIQQYKSIVSKFANDRAVVADSLIRMADCYQKLGDKESRRIYEQILKDYADQKGAVTVARARLGKEQGTTDARLSFRQVWKLPQPGGDDAAGLPSPDGRYLPYVDWEQHGNLFVHDFSTDTNRPLTDTATDSVPGTKVDQFALSASFSRDSRHVAYSWYRSDVAHDELRLVDVREDGVPQPRFLYSSPDVSWIMPADWSPDGKLLAVSLHRTDHTSQIALVSIADGAVRVLKSLDWRGPTTIVFSPDGKYLAYDIPADDSTDQRDVFVLAADASREIPAIVGPSQDTVVGWSDDGTRLLFASNRSGSEELWSIPFGDGKIGGPPELLRRDIGQFSRLGFMGGRLYGIVHSSNAGGSVRGDVYTAAIDVANGKLQSTPSLAVQTYVGYNTFPSWSPDGKYLAYATRRGSVGPQHFIIAIRSADTGEVREISPSPGLDLLWVLRWASDGLSLWAVGADTKGRYGIFTIDAQTGRNSILATKEDSENIPGVAGISVDGKKLYYARRYYDTDPRGGAVLWIEKDLQSGSEKQLRRTSNLALGPLSPDGKYLAIVNTDASKPRAISLLSTAGGEQRELAPEAVGGGGGLQWSADSRALYTRKGSELWRFPIDGSEARKVDLKLNGEESQIANFQVHPDGRRIALQMRVASTPAEIWVLENFKPVLKTMK